MRNLPAGTRTNFIPIELVIAAGGASAGGPSGEAVPPRESQPNATTATTASNAPAAATPPRTAHLPRDGRGGNGVFTLVTAPACGRVVVSPACRGGPSLPAGTVVRAAAAVGNGGRLTGGPVFTFSA